MIRRFTAASVPRHLFSFRASNPLVGKCGLKSWGWMQAKTAGQLFIRFAKRQRYNRFSLRGGGSATMSGRWLQRPGPRQAGYALLLLLSCASHAAWGAPTSNIVHQSPSIYDPHSGPARMIEHLSFFVIQVTAAIFIVVASLWLYVVVRFRQRDPNDDSEPPQIYGSTQI